MSVRKIYPLALMALLASAAQADHDEPQKARLLIGKNAVYLEILLEPDSKNAWEIKKFLGVDCSKTITPNEIELLQRALISSVSINVDSTPQALSPIGMNVDPMGVLLKGSGAIMFEARAELDRDLSEVAQIDVKISPLHDDNHWRITLFFFDDSGLTYAPLLERSGDGTELEIILTGQSVDIARHNLGPLHFENWDIHPVHASATPDEP